MDKELKWNQGRDFNFLAIRNNLECKIVYR